MSRTSNAVRNCTSPGAAERAGSPLSSQIQVPASGSSGLCSCFSSALDRASRSRMMRPFPTCRSRARVLPHSLAARDCTLSSHWGYPDKLGDAVGGAPYTTAPASTSWMIFSSSLGVMVSNRGSTRSLYAVPPGNRMRPSFTRARSIRMLGEHPSKPYPFLSASGPLPCKALAGARNTCGAPSGVRYRMSETVTPWRSRCEQRVTYS